MDVADERVRRWGVVHLGLNDRLGGGEEGEWEGEEERVSYVFAAF